MHQQKLGSRATYFAYPNTKYCYEFPTLCRNVQPQTNPRFHYHNFEPVISKKTIRIVFKMALYLNVRIKHDASWSKKGKAKNTEKEQKQGEMYKLC